jgi:VanZ family protein
MADIRGRGGFGGTRYARVVTAACICVLCIILIAGLWPLHIPTNKVSWLKNQNGLVFGRYGSVVSAGPFRGRDLAGDAACSLEIWLEPARTDQKKTILSFDGSSHPGDPFSLQQDKDALRIQRYNVDGQGTARTAWFMVDGVFRDKKPVFVTITLGEQDTSVYVNGVLAKVSPHLGVSRNNLTGRFVVADSPTASNNWSGQILGLAIYRQQLAPAPVAQHWENWSNGLRPALVENEDPVALYLFDEGKGSIVHNQLDPATDLIIPSHYSVLHSGFLLTPWREYKPTLTYWQDFIVNITGFIPLGLFWAAYFSTVRVIDRARTATILLGFAVSLTIELLQAYLPTRSSGMTDLFTNTMGTAIGALLYSCSFTQKLLCKAMHNPTDLMQDPSEEKSNNNARLVTSV